MEAQVVAIEVKPILGIGTVTYATGLAFGADRFGAEPLILSTCPVPPNHAVAVALQGRVLEAQVVANATVERSTEAFSSLASRGWRCGSGGSFLEPSMSCRLQLLLLRPKLRLEGLETLSQAPFGHSGTLRVSFRDCCASWIGQRVALHAAPFGARVDAPGATTWARFARVVMQGVVSNLSCPPGLLMSDVHAAESCAGAAVVLQSSNEVIALMAPSLRSSSGESVALSLAIPMSMILDTLLDNDACREELKEELAALPVPCAFEASPPCEVRQGVALLWLDSGSWASAIVLSEQGHLLTCAHLLTSVSWMEGQQVSGRSTARQCRGRCYLSQEGKIVSTTFEADVLQIFEGCLDAALLLARPMRHGVVPLFNPSLWQRRATAEELVQGIEVSAVGYGLFGPGCPWQGPAVTTGQLCKIAYSCRLDGGRRAAVLQSSAAVHRGCSGGALVAQGRLLGMVTTNVKQQDGSVMPHVNFILPVTLLTPICIYLENLKVLPAEQALKRLTEELRFSAANEEEQGLWRLETETLELPSRMLARKRHALRRLDQLQKEAEEEVERQEQQREVNGSAARSKL